MPTPQWWAENRSVYKTVSARLARDYPDIFNPLTPLPLKLGIELDLMHEYDGILTGREIRTFMTFWASRREYVVAVACHRVRYGIQFDTYPLDDAHKQHAQKVVEKFANEWHNGGLNAKEGTVSG